MKHLFKFFIIISLICSKNALAQDKFDISVSTDETNVIYVGLTNTIQFNINNISSDQLLLKFQGNNGLDLDSAFYKITRISSNTYILEVNRRADNEILVYLCKKEADSTLVLGIKKFKIRNVPRPTIDLGWIPEEQQWDYLMNNSELKVSMPGMVRKDFEYKIVGYDFILISRDGPKKVTVSGNSLQPVKSILKENKIDSVFYMFSNIKAKGPSGTVYLENIGRMIGNGENAKTSLESYYAKKMSKTFDFQKAIQNKLLQISMKIHNASLAGKIQPYWDEALMKKCSRDSYSMVGSRMYVTQIPVSMSASDDFKDSAYIEKLSESEMVSDIGFGFKFSSLKQGSLQRDILSLAPMYFEKFLNGQKFNIPIAWFTYKDVRPLLSNDDIKFIEAYTWYVQPLAEQNRSNIYQSKLERLAKNKMITYTQSNTGEHLGTELLEYWRHQLYTDFQQNKFLLLIGLNKTISEPEFRNLHTIKINTLIQDTAYPDDPEKLLEVFYFDIPSAFDSIYFDNIDDKSYLYIHQKTDVQDIKHSYQVLLSDIKPLVEPQAYVLLETLLSDKRQKMHQLNTK
jgi:ribosomal protein S17E